MDILVVGAVLAVLGVVGWQRGRPGRGRGNEVGDGGGSSGTGAVDGDGDAERLGIGRRLVVGLVAAIAGGVVGTVLPALVPAAGLVLVPGAAGVVLGAILGLGWRGSRVATAIGVVAWVVACAAAAWIAVVMCVFVAPLTVFVEEATSDAGVCAVLFDA